MTEPTTEAGRALLADYRERWNAYDHVDPDELLPRIAAIEAQARADAVATWLASEDAERRLAAALAKRMPLVPPDEYTRFSPKAEQQVYERTAQRILAALRETPDAE
jgi:hypothetical protein